MSIMQNRPKLQSTLHTSSFKKISAFRSRKISSLTPLHTHAQLLAIINNKKWPKLNFREGHQHCITRLIFIISAQIHPSSSTYPILHKSFKLITFFFNLGCPHPTHSSFIPHQWGWIHSLKNLHWLWDEMVLSFSYYKPYHQRRK